MSLHQIRTHPEPVAGCFGCRVGDGPMIGYCRSATNPGKDRTAQKRWDAELDRYSSAVHQGIQPEGTSATKIRAAENWSQHYGEAYSADKAEAKVKHAIRETSE